METFFPACEKKKQDRCWYAIRVRAKCERVTSAALREKGYEEFLPLYRCRRKWSDRVKVMDVPLFPGYVFCRFNASDRLLPILTIPGVVHIVGAGKAPLPIADKEIEAIQTVSRAGLEAQPLPFLNAGCRVYLERGPLAGIEGIVIQVNTNCRLVLSVNLLQRSVAIEIDRNWASPISKSSDLRLMPLPDGLRASGKQV